MLRSERLGVLVEQFGFPGELEVPGQVVLPHPCVCEELEEGCELVFIDQVDLDLLGDWVSEDLDVLRG